MLLKKYFPLSCCLLFTIMHMALAPMLQGKQLQDVERPPRRIKGFCCERLFDTPEAFEKIYVDCCSQILSMASGTYLKHDNGDLELVRALLADCKGMYVLRIYTQCPLCGRCYTGKSSPDGYDCPLYDKEIFPGIWTTP